MLYFTNQQMHDHFSISVHPIHQIVQTIKQLTCEIMAATWNQLTKVCVPIKMQIVLLKLIYIPWQFFNDSNPHLNVQTTLFPDWTLAWHVYDMLHQNKIPSPLTFIMIAAPLNSRILTLISKRDTEKNKRKLSKFSKQIKSTFGGKVHSSCLCLWSPREC